MSNQSTFSSSTFSSSSSSSTINGQTTGTSYSEQTHTNPDGTTVRTSSQNHGQPAVEQTKHYDNQGREQLGNGANGGQAKIEDVTDADKLYEERMEDEYAKREGGA